LWNKRLSDKLLAILLFLLAFEIQDYTFGFSGINILWNELFGFPRGLTLLIGPTLYFYIRSQTNTLFTFKWKHALHLVPWAIKFFIELSIYVQGRDTIQSFYASDISSYLSIVERLIRYSSYILYFYFSVILYRRYREWTINHVSYADSISFTWFRNVIYGIIMCFVVKEGINTISNIYQLEFYQDWWWNLVIVAIIIYIGIRGYNQIQPAHIDFDPFTNNKLTPTNEHDKLIADLENLMKDKKPFLRSDLTLSELSRLLSLPTNEVSSAINSIYKKNFNDYINEKRIKEFQLAIHLPENKDYTILAVAIDCGFNSKSTFNRAFKKSEGVSPTEWLDS